MLSKRQRSRCQIERQARRSRVPAACRLRRLAPSRATSGQEPTFEVASPRYGLVIVEGIMRSGKSTTMRFLPKACWDARSARPPRGLSVLNRRSLGLARTGEFN